jgi:co-chaperonin GroES (HSP10)
VDKRLTTDKHWRDVYQYDGDRLVGWKRYHTGVKPVVVEFTAEGWLVLAKDAKGRPTKASTVIYGQAPLKKPTFANTNPLVPMRGDEVITFEYEGDKRKIKSREKVKET